METYNVHSADDHANGHTHDQMIDNTTDHFAAGNPRVLLSALWTYVLLSTLFRDVHELFRPGFVADLVDTTVRGEPVDQAAVLAGGIALQVPLALVPLTLVLARPLARWANVVGSIMMAGGLLAIWPKDADDLVFGAFQLIGLAIIILVALRWNREPSAAAATRRRPDRRR